MGHAIVGGGARASVPISGIKLSTLAEGSTVKLMENGTAVDYLVVNQGIPSGSSLYDASCDGTWLLRKDIVSSQVWDKNDSDYQNSNIHSYLNNTFLSLFDSVTKSAIKQVKVPYVNGPGGSAIVSGASGLSTKSFLLSGFEAGFTSSDSSFFSEDGACLSYFNGAQNSKRIAYLDGIAKMWWLRSTDIETSSGVYGVNTDGSIAFISGIGADFGVRPALILPSTAKFDKDTLVFKGV